MPIARFLIEAGTTTNVEVNKSDTAAVGISLYDKVFGITQAGMETIESVKL